MMHVDSRFYYRGAPVVLSFDTNRAMPIVAQEPAVQVIGVKSFAGLPPAPGFGREIIGQLPSGF